MNGITGNDRAMMGFIARFLEEHSYAPTIRDIQRGLGISTTSLVSHRLQKLQDRGLVRRTPGVARSLTIVGPREAWTEVRA